jgi:FkbM family methyltransferase
LVAVQGKFAGTEAELVELRDAHEQALNTAAVLRQGLDNANAELHRKEAPIEHLTVPEPLPAVNQPVPARRPLRRFTGRLGLLCYRLVRPVVRPVAWRVRGFLTGPSLAEIGSIRDQLRLIEERMLMIPLHPQTAAQLDHLARSTAEVHARSSAQLDHLVRSTAEVHARSSAQLDHLARSTAEVHAGSSAQLKQLTKAIEDTVVTLAIASPHQSAGDAAPSDRQAATSRTLHLARGRLADIEVGAADLSVGAALHGGNGDWEPHVRGYLESVVRSDWVCMDIGANLGVHTLSLAILAHSGRVIAFEAHPGNYALLIRNVAALPEPKGHVEPVHAALWDSPGYLTIGSAEELAGCAFVACGATDVVSTEERLRTVVDPSAIAGVELQVRLARVPAVRLDDWVRDHPLPRLDLIKLDVEGAEANVIRGADDTLRRLRPRLLVEYNSACAAAYFSQPADALYHELAKRFTAVYAIEPDASLSPIPDWSALEARLATGKGWEDLLCIPDADETAPIRE